MVEPDKDHKADITDRDAQPGGKPDERRRGPDNRRRQQTSGGEDMSGEGSPGLTITGGGGHA